jgi:hypothetical protein
MKSLWLFNLLLFFLFACNQAPKKKQIYTYDNTFELDLKIFKVKYNDTIYPVVLEERSFYYMLDNAHKITSEIAYFKHKKTYWNMLLEIDSLKNNNVLNDIVFENRSNKKVVDNYYRNIKDHPITKGQLLRFDTSFKQVDRINIFYLLLKDSMKIGQQDITGYYFLY